MSFGTAEWQFSTLSGYLIPESFTHWSSPSALLCGMRLPPLPPRGFWVCCDAAFVLGRDFAPVIVIYGTLARTTWLCPTGSTRFGPATVATSSPQYRGTFSAKTPNLQRDDVALDDRGGEFRCYLAVMLSDCARLRSRGASVADPLAVADLRSGRRLLPVTGVFRATLSDAVGILRHGRGCAKSTVLYWSAMSASILRVRRSRLFELHFGVM